MKYAYLISYAANVAGGPGVFNGDCVVNLPEPLNPKNLVQVRKLLTDTGPTPIREPWITNIYAFAPTD